MQGLVLFLNRLCKSQLNIVDNVPLLCVHTLWTNHPFLGCFRFVNMTCGFLDHKHHFMYGKAYIYEKHKVVIPNCMYI